MKKAALLLVALTSWRAGGRADFVIVQKVDGLGAQTGNITVKIKEGKARVDVTPQISNLIDANTGDTVTLMHAQKSFIKVPAAQTQVLMEQMKKMQAANGAAPSKPAATGQKETVDQWATEIFTWSSGALSAKYWVAKDYPNYTTIQAAMEKVQGGGLAGLAKGLMPSNADFPGMIVKSEIRMGPKTITNTIVSVKEEAIDAKQFEVPEDYKETATPEFKFPTPAGK